MNEIFIYSNSVTYYLQPTNSTFLGL